MAVKCLRPGVTEAVRTIAVVTVGRSDYGLYGALLRRIHADEELDLRVIVAGTHLSPEFGLTVREIEQDGFLIADRVATVIARDTPEAIARSLALGVTGFARAFAAGRPDILLVLGDRFEMYAAALAALPFAIPVAHVHGGEVTSGAIDDALRHSMTKLSHLHFTSTEEYARRVRQLGEEPWRVSVSGAPGLDNLRTTRLIDRQELAARFGVPAAGPFLLCTFHPVTLEFQETEWHMTELLAALDAFGVPVLLTAPNADTEHRLVRRNLEGFVDAHPTARLIECLGTQVYFSVMSVASAMVGNSSSGLIEAPSFKLPVVNIGTRQAGRVRARNVIDVGYERDDILGGLVRAVNPVFRSGLRDLVNPYGLGDAAGHIVRRLKALPLGRALIEKRFCDIDEPSAVPVDASG